MKKFTAVLLCICVLLSVFAGCAQTEQSDIIQSSESEETTTVVEAISKADEWVNAHIESNDLFSFDYNAVEFSQFIGEWEKSVDTTEDEDGNRIITLSYTQPTDKVTAVATITVYKDSPAVDWIIYFTNNGSSDSPVISNIRALNAEYEIDGDEIRVNHPAGSTMSEDDFKSQIVNLSASSDELSFANDGGRSSDGNMPYFDISNGEEGIIGAIGWSGQWTCNMKYTENGVRIDAGMRKTAISLHAEEDMRTPSIVLLFFEGDVNDDGHNLWRDMMLNHYNPTDESGEPVTTMPVWDTIGGGVKYKDAMNYIKRVNNGNVYYDGVWIDAGWYSEDTSTSDWYEATGNWSTPESRYPDGYSVLTDVLKEDGKGFMLWFEPERAMEGTAMVENYPQYFMYQYKSAQHYVWNFADDEAVDFLVDYISEIIQDYGITWYRQDCNMDPLPRWEITDDMDGENRTGITEIKYITNMYRYWDELVEQNDGLMIDNCAAGGRRLDIEMCKRSLACWRSDYYNIEGTADGCRKIAMNISYWLPVSGGGESATEGNDNAYEYRSSMVNQVLVRTYPKGGRQWNTLTDQYLEIREAMAKNYYGLLVPEDYATGNGAYEFIDPETGKGFIALFRPEKSSDDSIFITLKGLDIDAEYVLTNMDGGDPVTASGKDLMEKGINITMNEARLSKLISIEKQ